MCSESASLLGSLASYPPYNSKPTYITEQHEQQYSPFRFGFVGDNEPFPIVRLKYFRMHSKFE